jgi:hypothetical protein
MKIFVREHGILKKVPKAGINLCAKSLAFSKHIQYMDSDLKEIYLLIFGILI